MSSGRPSRKHRIEREQDSESDSEEVDSSEEEEILVKKPSKKKAKKPAKKGVNFFIDEDVDVDDDEDSDYSVAESDIVVNPTERREIQALRAQNENRARTRPSTRDKFGAMLQNMTNEQLAEYFENRHAQEAPRREPVQIGGITEEQVRAYLEAQRNQALAEDYEEDDQSGSEEENDVASVVGVEEEISRVELLPAVGSSNLWIVKVKLGEEKNATMQLMRKCIAFSNANDPLHINSIVSPDILKGKIYVEARKKTNVERLIQGVSAVISNNISMVPVKDMPDALRVTKALPDLQSDDYVRLTRTIYKGDLAQVDWIAVIENKVCLRLLPRIDYRKKNGSNVYQPSSSEEEDEAEDGESSESETTPAPVDNSNASGYLAGLENDAAPDSFDGFGNDDFAGFDDDAPKETPAVQEDAPVVPDYLADFGSGAAPDSFDGFATDDFTGFDNDAPVVSNEAPAVQEETPADLDFLSGFDNVEPVSLGGFVESSDQPEIVPEVADNKPEEIEEAEEKEEPDETEKPKKKKRVFNDRPPQVLFDSRKMRKTGAKITIDGDFTICKGQRYRGGLLYRVFPLSSITDKNIRPTVEELKPFKNQSTTDAEFIKNLGQPRIQADLNRFVAGDVVEVIEGGLTGLRGKIQKVGKDMITVLPEKLKTPATFNPDDLVKFFKVGDHVRVIGGDHENSTGNVVSVTPEEIIVLSDMGWKELKVQSYDLQLTVGVSTATFVVQKKTMTSNVVKQSQDQGQDPPQSQSKPQSQVQVQPKSQFKPSSQFKPNSSFKSQNFNGQNRQFSKPTNQKSSGGWNVGEKQDRSLIGKTVRILQGPMKGYLGTAKDATESIVRIELFAQPRVISVDRSRVGVVDGNTLVQTQTPFEGWNTTPSNPPNVQTPVYDQGSFTPMYGAGAQTPMGDSFGSFGYDEK